MRRTGLGTMPSLGRRRETDFRAERLESEVRSHELLKSGFEAKRKFMCSHCGRVFEERSRNCPRCDKTGMGELKQIPEKYLDEARRGALRRAQARAKS
jgi:hypothetical protein